MRAAAQPHEHCHTNVSPLKDAKFGLPSLPLKLYLFEDGLFIRAARPDFAPLVRQPGWAPLPPQASVRVWTDDASDLVSVLTWK